MKIGFSLGRCVRDIVNGVVDINDVAWIIASTCIRDEVGLEQVIKSYTMEPGYLLGLDEAECQRIAADLYTSGRVLQPRLQGIGRTMVPENSIWADLYPTVNSENSSLKRAWDGYRMMLHMVAQLPEDADIHWR